MGYKKWYNNYIPKKDLMISVKDLIKKRQSGEIEIFLKKGRHLAIDYLSKKDVLFLVGTQGNIYIFDSVDSIYNDEGNLVKRSQPMKPTTNDMLREIVEGMIAGGAKKSLIGSEYGRKLYLDFYIKNDKVVISYLYYPTLLWHERKRRVWSIPDLICNAPAMAAIVGEELTCINCGYKRKRVKGDWYTCGECSNKYLPANLYHSGLAAKIHAKDGADAAIKYLYQTFKEKGTNEDTN